MQQAQRFCVPLAGPVQRSLQRLALDQTVVLDALQLCSVLCSGELCGVLCLCMYRDDALLGGLDVLLGGL